MSHQEGGRFPGPQVIPAEAVEAAAKVTFEGLYDDEMWEDVTPAERVPYEFQARAALEAAAPHMLAHGMSQTPHDFDRPAP